MQKCDFHDFRVVNNIQLQMGCLKLYVSQLLLPLFIISDILQSVIDCICACFNVSKWTIFFCGMLNWGLPRFNGIGLQMALAFIVSNDIQLLHTGPALPWHVFRPVCRGELSFPEKSQFATMPMPLKACS